MVDLTVRKTSCSLARSSRVEGKTELSACDHVSISRGSITSGVERFISRRTTNARLFNCKTFAVQVVSSAPVRRAG